MIRLEIDGDKVLQLVRLGRCQSYKSNRHPLIPTKTSDVVSSKLDKRKSIITVIEKKKTRTEKKLKKKDPWTWSCVRSQYDLTKKKKKECLTWSRVKRWSSQYYLTAEEEEQQK
ncbi:Hypothetical predicted protein [Olea europaea subsp. europaea]|uniref:Uncharacterized protein n=1 Tax=Olea europaea subsp. europaea TaxID=158383 RepID=A0A8S0U890_OLEEU|nr:Hypothetical predicted protein [Olea europaea subsp. europaea]